MKTTKTESSSGWLGIVREKVESLRFGVVQIAVHNGKVVQVDRTEKTRIEPSPTREESGSILEPDHWTQPTKQKAKETDRKTGGDVATN